MQAAWIKEVNLMTGRHLCGFYAVAVPDEYKMYSRKEADRKHSKESKLGELGEYSQPFFDVPENLTRTS